MADTQQRFERNLAALKKTGDKIKAIEAIQERA
jgi:hypothetical protein